jgi:hypothetical protein
MLTRREALRGHSPALWGLVAACAVELLVVTAWTPGSTAPR